MLYWLKLKRIRIREQKKMYKTNLKLYKKIIEYINNSNLKYIEKEEALHQIMDAILQSEAEAKSVDVTMENYEEFCKSIIKEYTNDKGAAYTILHHLQRSIINMLIILVLGIVFLNVLHPEINTGISTMLLIPAIGIAFILMPYRHDRKQRKWSSIIYFIAVLWPISFVTETPWGEIIDNILIPNTNIILMGMVLIVAAIEVYKRVSDRKTINSGKC